MIKLAPVAVRTVFILVEVLALFGSIVIMDVDLLLELMLSVSEGAFGPIVTLTHLPIAANFCFKLLLEIRRGSTLISGLNCFNLGLVVNIPLVVGFVSAFALAFKCS